MPGRFELKPTLAKIWHAPDNFRIMDPLPLMHRRGIIIAALLMIIGFLLPANDEQPVSSTSREAQQELQSQTQPSSSGQAFPVQNQQTAPALNEPQQTAPLEPEPVQEQPQDEVQDEAQAPVSAPAAGGIEQQWRSYRIEQGKTLAQLFRDHNLPPTDVYAMAKVEGAGKPLSSLQSGQMVKIRQNASGVVTGLTIEGADGQVLFTRQQDGSFIRAR